jgi:signal transduction histidine kinase/DNA-binding response OmpR family regulator
MIMPLLTLEIRLEADVVLARQRARQIAGLLGCSALDQTRIATASSEIARNAYQYAGGGKVAFGVEPGPPARMVVRIEERGPGINDLQAILEGEYLSSTGMGVGIVGAKRLMDEFEIVAQPGAGVCVTMAKDLPRNGIPVTGPEIARIAAELTRVAPSGLLEELQVQNQELLRTLHELREQQAAVAEAHTRELEETNRGVVALYSELDENAKALRRIADLKSRFLSNMSHEFRSPLNSIVSLVGFLLDRGDGPLTLEQERQVHFIRQSAEGLSLLVNDLLDLAKVEAGKAVVRLGTFVAADLFTALKGTIRPILPDHDVALVFEDTTRLEALYSDEGKLAQILRNFLSNAVKFTERGEIRIRAAEGDNDTAVFSVADTGIGIAPEHQELIFEEFGQIEGPLQQKSQGTGLGLPLSRKLAELLGGTVAVRSVPGAGSTFSVTIPRVYGAPGQCAEAVAAWQPVPGRLPVLVVEDDPATLFLYEKYLEGTRYHVLPARTLGEARQALRRVRPAAIVLDAVLGTESAWPLIAELRSGAGTRDIAVLVIAGSEGEERALELGANDFCAKPVPRVWLLERLRAHAAPETARTILVVDDVEADRHQLRQLLVGAAGPHVVLEADGGGEGLRLARLARPDVIFLDLLMPDLPGFEVIARLKAEDDTKRIPIIIHTSKVPDESERHRLAASVASIVIKPAGNESQVQARIRDALARAFAAAAPLAAEG